jgi:hypothetical protein
MTKDEAFEALENGKKITHRLFDPDEWMTMDFGLIVFEDGINCTEEEFFKFRQGKQWEDGYELFHGITSHSS